MTTTPVPAVTIVHALGLACRAPSLHNSQPWRWAITDAGVDLFADPQRLLRTADASGREALISCGAALDHFRVAMAAAGWQTHVQRFPDPDNTCHLARIEFSATADAEDHRRRADAILLRRSDRLAMAAPPDWELLIEALELTSRHGAARLAAVADDVRGPLAEASHLADALRLYDSRYHAELSWWTADFNTGEGIPHSALISAAESDRVHVGRAFPVTTAPDRHGRPDEDHAGILVLSTDDDCAESVLRCGEALSAVLLEATMAGMATCTVTHITEIPEGRDVVAALIDSTAIPQVLVRVGLAPALDPSPPPTPRRAVEDVLEMRSGSRC
ncbi:NAD(P)H nitroreductase [Mycobacterium sp. ITM-2016-00317]|uniref:Acg family FMN-binding oxidoreductase n=1 Tax=Mycobacterium sp. ITM-2016-00317 TaxID=2099694 RepID=UPI00287FC28C|nr:NAD(P)H nitroreductase [Mycobacterium sp. ITM-2016-00317]WNG89762.1 NAD(P)H nitroreductase [Mycobacterium sp. ITM-2016-00317]